MPNSVLDVGLRVGKMETDKFKGKYSHSNMLSASGGGKWIRSSGK